MPIAILRKVSPAIAQCELTHVERQPIDVELANRQHQQYADALAAAGYELIELPAETSLPDSVFVEDTAIVLDELAIITRPGAESRRAETSAVAAALTPYRRLVHIQEPGTIDGGDVLRVGKQVFIGLSQRTNSAAVEQVRAALEHYGYQVIGVPLDGCLHLKSAVTQVGEDTLLVNRAWIDTRHFENFNLIDVHPDEPYGANALWIGDRLIYPAEYPKTRARLEEHGISIRTVPVSELAKAEGAVTCCSLIVDKIS